jgi:phage terminase large subunit-like protein
MHPAEQYAKDVSTGKIKTGELIKLAVKRYYRDLTNAKKKGWYFDKDEAQRHIDFTTLCYHYKGAAAGQPIKLLPHQIFHWWNLYGWHNTKDGSKRFRVSYEEVARKNGKTTGSALRGNDRIILTEPQGAQVYCAATKENQANILVTDSANTLITAPYLKNLIEIKQIKEQVNRVITKTQPVSYIRSIGRDSKTEDGRHASELKIDEYHAWDSNYLKEVMEESMKGRLNPLTDITTTAGLPFTGGKDGVCYAFRKVCIDVLKEIKEDDTLFIMIHSMDEGDDWENPENWHKSNPSLDAPGCVTLDDLEKDFVKAKNEGQSKLVSFKTKSLNIWTDAPKVWVEDNVWMIGKAKPQIRDVKWFAGYDGGRTYDFSSWVLLSEPDENGIHDVIPYFWIPDETLEQREKEDRTTYRDWRAGKYLFTTPGNSISTDHIRQHIVETMAQFEIVGTFYDPALFAGEMMAKLVDEFGSDKFEPYSQAIWTANGNGMSPPTKLLEIAIKTGKLRHGGHPVLRWNCRNSELLIDKNENIKIIKGNPKQRVDGMVALVMAMARYDRWKKDEITTDWGITTIKM